MVEIKCKCCGKMFKSKRPLFASAENCSHKCADFMRRHQNEEDTANHKRNLDLLNRSFIGESVCELV